MSRCVWVDRDPLGRPRCEHGWAHKCGDYWTCPKKNYAKNVRYRATDKGRAARARENLSDAARSSKQLYELTRIRLVS